MKKLCSLLFAMLLGGCSLVTADLDRTRELAMEAGKKSVVECVDVVRAEMAKLRTIREKDAKGVLSASLLAYLYEEQVRVSEPVIRVACDEVAGALLLQGLSKFVD